MLAGPRRRSVARYRRLGGVRYQAGRRGRAGGGTQHGRDLCLVDARRATTAQRVDPAEFKPVIEAIAARDLAGGIEATPPELAERLSISGTPQKCVEKIQREIEPAGVNHMILAITDAALVKAFTSRDLPAADVNTQLQLVHDEIMPAFT